MAVCDRDCFNCRFEDCVLDEEASAEEIARMERIEERYLKTEEQREKERQRAAGRAYYQRNREAILARDAEKRKSDPEYRKRKAEYAAAWYAANKDRAREQSRARRAKKRADPEYREKNAARSKAYYAANRDKCRAAQAAWRETHRAEIAAYHKAYRARKKEEQERG